MSYVGTNAVSIPPSVVSAARRDQFYFREILAPDVRRIYEAADEVLDPMEYEGSLLFDEYPDAGEISRLTDVVLCKVWGQGNIPVNGSCAEEKNANAVIRDQALTRELARALLCGEMYRRRFRHLMRCAGAGACEQ